MSMECVTKARDGRTKDIMVVRTHIRDTNCFTPSKTYLREAGGCSHTLIHQGSLGTRHDRGSGTTRPHDFRSASQQRLHVSFTHRTVLFKRLLLLSLLHLCTAN